MACTSGRCSSVNLSSNARPVRGTHREAGQSEAKKRGVIALLLRLLKISKKS